MLVRALDVHFHKQNAYRLLGVDQPSSEEQGLVDDMSSVLCLIVLSGSHGSVEQGRKEEGGKVPREHAAFCRGVVALYLCDSVGHGICSGV